MVDVSRQDRENCFKRAHYDIVQRIVTWRSPEPLVQSEGYTWLPKNYEVRSNFYVSKVQ